MNRTIATTALSAVTLAAALPAGAATTVTFQNGVNGYAGTVNELVSSSSPNTVVAPSTLLGLDGLATDQSPVSPDAQGLIRFDNVFGTQIPAGATVLSASLTLTTHNASASQSNGPYGVAALLRPFDPTTTTYNNFVIDGTAPLGSGANVGPSYLSGTATRPVAGIGVQPILSTATVNVTQFVRAWANGSMANYGFAVNAGTSARGTGANTSDGWTVRSATYATVANRPQLSVTYTTDPTAVTHLQQGVNGYSGTTMALVTTKQGAESTTDGAAITQDFLDADDTTLAGNPSAVLRFDNIADSRPTPTATLLSATLNITTGESSDNARSGGTFEIDALNAPFTLDKTYSQYGATGPTGTTLSSVGGLINGSVAQFDVTAYVQSVLAGGDNFGWALRSSGTTDGWMLNFTGADDLTARPDLTLVWSTAGSVPEPTALAAVGLAGATLLRRRRR